MVILNLVMALAVNSSAVVVMPQDTLGPARRGEIAVLASDWVSAKSRMYRMSGTLLEAAVKAGQDRRSITGLVTTVRKLATEVEEVQYAASQLARQAVIDSEPPSAARLEREQAVTALFEGRALLVYSNLAPLSLDEEVKDAQGRSIGRRFAGPEWIVSLTKDEGAAYSRWQLARTGFTAAEYQLFINKAAASLGYPAPSEVWP